MLWLLLDLGSGISMSGPATFAAGAEEVARFVMPRSLEMLTSSWAKTLNRQN